LVVNPGKGYFAVIDGMGGVENGEVAARILAQELHYAFASRYESASDAFEVHKKSSGRMSREGVGNGGACYLAGKIKLSELHTYQAGDVKLKVFKKSGRIETTEDEAFEGAVTNFIDARIPRENIGQGKVTENKFKLDVGDIIVAASDGLWDNVVPEKVQEFLKSSSPEKVIKKIFDEAMRGRKRDNISILIYIIESLQKHEEIIGEGTKPTTISSAREVNGGFEKYNDEGIRNKINLANSFDELYKFLNSIKGLQGSIKFYDPVTLIRGIENVRKGKLYKEGDKHPVGEITNTCGLRDKVIKLLEDEGNYNF